MRRSFQTIAFFAMMILRVLVSLLAGLLTYVSLAVVFVLAFAQQPGPSVCGMSMWCSYVPDPLLIIAFVIALFVSIVTWKRIGRVQRHLPKDEDFVTR